MQSIYYWKKYEPSTRLRRGFNPRDVELRSRIDNTPNLNLGKGEPIQINLPTFAQMYGKWIVCSSLVGFISAIILTYYFFDFAVLGAGFFFYLVVLGCGIVGGIALPFKWARQYRRFKSAVQLQTGSR